MKDQAAASQPVKRQLRWDLGATDAEAAESSSLRATVARAGRRGTAPAATNRLDIDSLTCTSALLRRHHSDAADDTPDISEGVWAAGKIIPDLVRPGTIIKLHSYSDTSKRRLVQGILCCVANIVLYVINGEATRYLQSFENSLQCSYFLIWVSHICQVFFLIPFFSFLEKRGGANWRLAKVRRSWNGCHENPSMRLDDFVAADDVEAEGGLEPERSTEEEDNQDADKEIERSRELDEGSEIRDESTMSPSDVARQRKARCKTRKAAAMPRQSDGFVGDRIVGLWAQAKAHAQNIQSSSENFLRQEMGYLSARNLAVACFVISSLYICQAWFWALAVGNNGMSLGIVTALFNTNPVFVFLFTAILYKEGAENIIQIVAILLAMLGVCLICYSFEGEPSSVWGVALAVSSSAMYGLFEVLYKNYLLNGKSDQPFHFIYFLIGLMGLFYLFIFWIPIPLLHFTGLEPLSSPSLSQGLLLALNSVCTTLFQCCLQLSLALLPSPILVSLASLLCMPTAEVTDWFLKTGRFTTPELIGSAFVGMSFLIMAAQEAKLASEEQHLLDSLSESLCYNAYSSEENEFLTREVEATQSTFPESAAEQVGPAAD